AALPLLLLLRTRRRRQGAVADPRRGPVDHRHADHPDGARRRLDRLEPLADRGHAAARAQDGAASRRGARHRAGLPSRAGGARAARGAAGDGRGVAVIALLFGTYNSRHAANSLLASDLRAAGFEVRECHEPLWEATRDKDAPYFAPL